MLWLLFYSVIIGLLSAVIGVAVEHRKACNSPFEWYKGSLFYTIDVPYFADSNEDTVGDLTGMMDKLDYLLLPDSKWAPRLKVGSF